MKSSKLLVMCFIITGLLVSLSYFPMVSSNPEGDGILITEVLYDTPGTDSIEEWIELFNPTTSDVDLTGWTISDNVGTFILSGLINSGNYIVIARDAGGFNGLYGTTPDLISGSSLQLSNSGDQLSLKDGTSTEVDFVAWENAVPGWSVSATHTTLVRGSEIDTDTVNDWQNSGNLGDPGSGNYDLTSGSILITEILYDTPGTDSAEEWVELYNPTSNSIDLTGWSISDNVGVYTFQSGIIIPSKAFLVLARQDAGFQALYGSSPDIIMGSTIQLSNSGDQLSLKDETSTEIDFVAWENYIVGWSISAVHTTIVRSSISDTDTVNDWVNSNSIGDPGAGSYGGGTSDATPPSVSISSPLAGSTIFGTRTISVSASDASGIVSYEIYVDTVLYSNSASYSWDTTTEIDGLHTILAKVEDGVGNTNEDQITVTIDNTNPPPPSSEVKFMTYNIEASGTNVDWKQVVKEENADIIAFVETGTWDDNNNVLLNQYCNELNSYFTGLGEVPYNCITTQGISFSTSGEAIFSRYPIVYQNQIPLVTLDDSSSFDVSHDFLHASIDINGEELNVIASHLKCCSGPDNENKRDRAQEGIINYMDGLGNVPIIYAGDLNSFSPQDIGALAPLGDLNYGPMSMMLLDDSFGSYSQFGPTVSTYVDAFRSLNPTITGYTYGHQNPIYNSRIDFIVGSQHFNGRFISSTTGDTATAETGSDHYSVDVVIDYSGGETDTTPPSQVEGLVATPVSDSQIDLSWTPNTEPDLNFYNIFRDGGWISTSMTSSFIDQGLLESTSYDYEVSAVDNSGNEGQKSLVTSGTTFDVTPPSQVIGLIAQGISSSQIDLTWYSNTESDFDYYNIYRNSIFVASSIVASYSDIGLMEGISYFYEVNAIDTSGNEGQLSQQAQGTTLDIPPNQVTGLTIESVTQNDINLVWTSNSESDLDHYNVYQDGILIGTAVTAAFTSIGLTSSTTYTYEISAIDVSGNEGLKSSSASGTTADAPSGSGYIIISEVYYDATGSDRAREWIEIYNPTSQIIDLSNWRIEDFAGNSFILSGLIVPGEFLVIARSLSGFNDFHGFNADLGGFGFALGNRGDAVYLIDNNNQIVDAVAWENKISGWNIFAGTGTSIARSTLNVDTDTVNDWIILTNQGTPGSF